MRLQQVVTVVGAHAEGEVGRVITGGVIAPRASSMFERQVAIQRDQDCLRLGSVTGTPSPRNDKVASSAIARPTWIVTMTMSGGMQFGSR